MAPKCQIQLEERDPRMEEIPLSLVFDVVIKQSIECPILLRTCRHVCRSWNVTASHVLRATAPVTIDERFPKRIEKFQKLRRNCRRTTLENLASPFRKMCLVATSFTDPDLLSVVNDLGEELIISELSLLNFNGDPRPKNFQLPLNILATHSQSLTTLSICWENFQEKLNANQILKYPNLTAADLIVEAQSEQVLKNLLTHPQMKTLGLRIKKCIPPFLRNLNWQDISEVKLLIERSKSTAEPDDPIKNLVQLPIVNVTELIVTSYKMVRTEIPQIVSKWSSSIKYLEIETPFLSINLPQCPKVEKLVLISTFRPDLINDKAFPSLKTIYFLEAPAFFGRSISNSGVQQIVFQQNRRTISDRTSPTNKNKSLHDSVNALTRSFPNVKHFTCDIRPYCARFGEGGSLASEVLEVLKHSNFSGDYRINY